MANPRKEINVLEKHSIALAIRVYLFMKNYDKAIGLITSSLSRWPEELDLLIIAQRVYNASQNWDAYIDVNERIEKMFPNNISFRLRFGTTLLSLHRYANALLRLIFCAKNWNLDASYLGNLTNVYGRLAICYGYMGKWDLLKATLQEVEELGAQYSDPDVIYGYLLYYKGTNSFPKIQDFLDEQIAKGSYLHALYYWKALYVQYYLHDLPGSLKWYRCALEKMSYISLKNPQGDYFYAPEQYAASWYILKQSLEVCIHLNRHDEALWLIYASRLRMLISNDDVRALMVYLDILKQSFDIAEKKCLGLLRKKLSMDARTEYWLLLALAQAKQGKLDDGLASVKQGLALHSEKQETWDLLGQIHMQKQDWQSAIEAFQRLIGMNYFNFQCWENLAFCYLNMGDISSARRSYEQAIQLNPSEADTWIDLANIYVQLGDNDLALPAYQNGLKYDWLNHNKKQQALQAMDQLKSQ